MLAAYLWETRHLRKYSADWLVINHDSIHLCLVHSASRVWIILPNWPTESYVYRVEFIIRVSKQKKQQMNFYFVLGWGKKHIWLGEHCRISHLVCHCHQSSQKRMILQMGASNLRGLEMASYKLRHIYLTQ